LSLNSEELENVRILVVDDHTLFAAGTVSLLSVEPSILVIGIAQNGIECMTLINKSMTDVVLLDINLPDICGVDLINKIKNVQPNIKIIMLTGQDPKGYITMSINKGADGFLLKNCSADEMLHAILTVNHGGFYYSEGLEAFLQPVRKSNNSPYPVESKTLRELLTTREVEIMELVVTGLHNKAIALALGIKVRTVDFHVSNILLKLGKSTRLEAVLRWVDTDNIEIKNSNTQI